MESTIKSNTKVTADNIREIQQLLAEGQGGILTVRNDRVCTPTSGCVMYLYTQAEIEKSTDGAWLIITKRGRELFSGVELLTKWENDREYTFRPVRNNEESKPITVGGMAFFVGMHSTVCAGFSLEDDNLAIYIPGGVDVENRERAVCWGLSHAIDISLRIRHLVSDDEAFDLWQYVRQDLKDSKALRASLIGG